MCSRLKRKKEETTPLSYGWLLRAQDGFPVNSDRRRANTIRALSARGPAPYQTAGPTQWRIYRRNCGPPTIQPPLRSLTYLYSAPTQFLRYTRERDFGKGGEDLGIFRKLAVTDAGPLPFSIDRNLETVSAQASSRFFFFFIF